MALCEPLVRSAGLRSQMSREGPPSVNKLKQIPRIFRNHRKLYSNRTITNTESNIVEVLPDRDHPYFLSVTPDAINKQKSPKNKQNTKTIGDCNKDTPTWILDISRSEAVVNNNEEIVEDIIESSENIPDVETVADIEKWLKTRTESVSSIDLDVMKSEVEGGEVVDRYLADELPHTFLEKDPDSLSIDIDLSDKKLNLGYDPILQELQSGKLLEEKDDPFILPEFRLDHLHPLALSPDDMMVAGEILPSPTNVPETSMEEATENNQRIKNLRIDDHIQENLCGKRLSSPAIDKSHKNDNQPQNIILSPDYHPRCESKENISSETSENSERRDNTTITASVTKKIRKPSERFNKKSRKMNLENCVNTRDSIMAVVAISTDKVSNTTQIIIDTNGEKQIYEGKTSELIEATGNFSKLPNLDDDAPSWSDPSELKVDSSISSNQHEVVISEALLELGITDDNLQPISITEHGKVWLCPREDCNRQFNRLYALKGHLLAHYGVRPFKCDFEGCAWAFYSEFKLKRHKETHLKKKDFVCQVNGCNRRFTTVYNLWSHEKLHSRPSRIGCHVPHCQEKFQTKRALQLHMKTHDQSHAPYVCKQEGCGKRYYSSNALTSHQRCHSYKEIDIKCSWPGCGKVFDKPCRLKAHTRSHTGYKPYPCTFQGCQWAFSSSSKLKRHQKKHTNERKFVCDVSSCGKAFMRSEHLKEHKLTHKEGRYFQCYICEARFSAKSSLYVHIKKHQNKQQGTNDSQDDKSVKNLSQTIVVEEHPDLIEELCRGEKEDEEERILNEAIFEINQMKTYDCPLDTCEGSFSTKSSLRTHMIGSHGTRHSNKQEEESESPRTIDADVNYVLYSTTSSQSAEQMIMLAPCDTTTTTTVILNDSPNTDDNSLPEPEPPPRTSSTKHDQSTPTNPTSSKRDQGSARTSLTFSDIWKLKTTNGGGMISDLTAVGACDVVLSPAHLEEGLMLTEELPSLYYQDDVVGAEYQVLLLDSGSSENAMNLRGLE